MFFKPYPLQARVNVKFTVLKFGLVVPLDAGGWLSR